MAPKANADSPLVKECIECLALFQVLREDLSEAVRQFDVRKSQFSRRMAVRAFFSFIEALCFKLRLIVLHAVESGLLQLTKDKLECLSRERIPFKQATRLALELTLRG